MENNRNQKRNIIFIPGINTLNWMVKKWDEELRKNFPEDDIYLMDELYFYTQHLKIHELINNVLEILKNNRESILIGHSFGGIIALVIYWRNKKKGRNNIKKIITMASPHNMDIFNLRVIKEELGYDWKKINGLNLITFGGRFDAVVPNRFTWVLNKPHKAFLTSHNGFLFSRRIIRKVIKYI